MDHKPFKGQIVLNIPRVLSRKASLSMSTSCPVRKGRGSHRGGLEGGCLGFVFLGDWTTLRRFMVHTSLGFQQCMVCGSSLMVHVVLEVVEFSPPVKTFNLSRP